MLSRAERAMRLHVSSPSIHCGSAAQTSLGSSLKHCTATRSTATDMNPVV